ncbi:hypothetical protein C2L65_41815 [Paraburkholderia terrae]|uniref:Protein glutaminase domain-containing protein n=2 Tax=Paraburkholderia terrae TaxID=311230 RepID=A0A2I8F5E0_9BURK|nr:hypothetical protein C2L65_41815 [Paraburkholderia terrae]
MQRQGDPAEPHELTVELETGDRATLDGADRRTPLYRQILILLQQVQHPVWLRLDGEGVIRSIRVPFVGKVLHLADNVDSVLVLLEGSILPYRLPRNSGHFDDWYGGLRRATETANRVIVAHDDGRIIDVQFPKSSHAPPADPPRLVPAWWTLMLRATSILRPPFFGCISSQQAAQMFGALTSLSCDPTAPSPTCIPFLLPKNLCNARCHAMCLVMKAKGYHPRVIWIRQSDHTFITARTLNDPSCMVTFPYHTAPVVCVRDPYVWMWQDMVFDPAFTSRPTPVSVWMAIFSRASPGVSKWEIVYTGQDDYYMQFPASGVSPGTESQFQFDLNIGQAELLKQTADSGPPPFNCP